MKKYLFLKYTVIINKTKYFRSFFATDPLAICAACVTTCPNNVGPANETLKRALVYAIIIPWIPSTWKETKNA